MRSKAIVFVALVFALAPIARVPRIHHGPCCHGRVRHHVQVQPVPPTAPPSPLDGLDREAF